MLKNGIVENISMRMPSGISLVTFEGGDQVFINSGMAARALAKAIEGNRRRRIWYLTDDAGSMQVFGFDEDMVKSFAKKGEVKK